MLLRRRFKAPVEARMLDQADEPERDADERMAIGWPRFDQADANVGIFAQPVGEHTSRRTRADDHIVVRITHIRPILPQPTIDNRAARPPHLLLTYMK